MTAKVIIPSEIFETVANSIRDSIAITNIVEKSGVYQIFCNTSYMTRNCSVELVDCLDLSGSYLIDSVYSSYITVKATKDLNFANGTLKAYPYFRWGTKDNIIVEQNQTNEYPCILHLISSYDYDPADINYAFVVKGSFDIYFLDLISNQTDLTSYSESKRIYDTVIKRMTIIANSFIEQLKFSAKINSISKEDYIKEGSGASADIKQGSTLNAQLAGCKLTINMSIDRSYECGY